MYEGSPADIQMERIILDEGFYDETVYQCEVITYNPEEERIYLLSKHTELPVFSLDGIYGCTIAEQGGIVQCKGIIVERYWNKLGRVMVFKVKNGFYKKVLN